MSAMTSSASSLTRGGKLFRFLLSIVLVVGLMPSLGFINVGTAFAVEDAVEVEFDEQSQYTIDTDGAYHLQEGAAGHLVITEGATEVTIVGNGVEYNEDVADTSTTGYGYLTSTPNSVTIDASQAPGIKLTIQDLCNANSSATTHGINFSGEDNELTFKGINVLDYECAQYMQSEAAGIHVGKTAEATTSLTIILDEDSRTYLYKKSSGACIGGTSSEMNGDITFDGNGALFAKGTKQSAVIGAGANASSTSLAPGQIAFTGNGSYNIITNSRGAAIGGSAGANGGSTGTTVTVTGSCTISVNTDYSGAVVGGGGYAQGNDSSGGTLIYNSGSFRPYVDKNTSSNVGTGWKGRQCTEGVNDAVITADRVNSDDNPVYFATIAIPSESDLTSTHTVTVDGVEVFSGTPHAYSYAFDGVDRESSEGGRDTSVNVYPAGTIGNWIPAVDSNLYIFMTGENHTVDVDGVSLNYVFDEETETFSVSEPEPEPSGNTITTSIVASTSPASGTAGTISVAETVATGETANVTVTPSAGYYLAGLTYTYGENTARIDVANNGKYDGVGGTYAFTMPDANVNVEATFVSIVWDGTLDFTWYDEASYVVNAKGTYDMYFPAQWEALAWICSEDLYFLTEDSLNASAASAQDETMTVAQYMTSKGWTKAYQYNTNGNVALVVGTIPTRTDLSVNNRPGENYFSGKTFRVMNDMDFGGTGTDYFEDTDLVSLTASQTGSDNPYYSHLGGHNYYPVGSQAKNDGIYKALDATAGNHFYATFCGSVDGQGHLMDNIYCDRGDASNIGGATGGSNYYQSTALIGRVGMSDNTSTELAANSCVIENIAVDGFIYGERSVGGIVGKTLHVASGNTVTVRNCINFATIWSTQSKGSGGIVGASWNGSRIEGCVNFGRCINGYSNGCGGITGSSEAAMLNCYNVGMVSLLSGNPASFASQNSGATATNCYALIGSTFSGSAKYSTAATPYLSYNIDGVSAINALSEASSSTFLSSINGTSRSWVKVGSTATTVDSSTSLKSAGLAKKLTTTKLFYSYNAAKEKGVQTGVANLPIPRVFTNDTETVTGITLTSGPAKTAYVETQTFDATGTVITATWSDGTTDQVMDYTVSNTNPLSVSDTGITLSGTYHGTEYNFPVTISVVANEISSIAFKTAPTKTIYASDDDLDTTGMVVTATYTASPTAVVLDASDYVASLDRENGAVSATYTFNGKSVSATTPITALNTPRPSEIDGVYQIATANDLKWFAGLVNAGTYDANAVLVEDIVETDTHEMIGRGTATKGYRGTFSGQGHTVTLNQASASSTYGYGLFGYVTTGANISNITLAGVVNGSQYTGGLIGNMNDGTVTNCINTATISGTQYTGGLIGYVKGGTISNCGNNGAVSSTTYHVGGLIGYAYAYVSAIAVNDCYNAGSVTASGVANISYGNGGLIGYASTSTGKAIAVSNCYNTGDVKANNCVGGLFGYVKGTNASVSVTATNCYNAGTVTNNAGASATYTGAVLGNGYNTYFNFSNVYYLGTSCAQAKGTSSKAGTFSATSMSAEDMKADTFLATLGDAFKADGAGKASINNGYPVLSWMELEASPISINSITVLEDAFALSKIEGSSQPLYLVTLNATIDEGYVPELNGTQMVKMGNVWCGLSESKSVSDSSISAVEGEDITLVSGDFDVNANGKVNIVDVQATYNIAIGGLTYGKTGPLSTKSWLAADTNNDKTIDSSDAFALQRHIHGL